MHRNVLGDVEMRYSLPVMFHVFAGNEKGRKHGSYEKESLTLQTLLGHVKRVGLT